MERSLRFSGLPVGAESPEAGGSNFVAYCLGSEARAEQRRDAILRARNLFRRAAAKHEDPYPSALILAQRLSVGLQDLARLLIAFEGLPANHAFDLFRGASIEAMDDIYPRLARDADAFRIAIQLPTASAVEDLDVELQAAMLAAADVLTKRWHTQWKEAAAGWQLLRRVGKSMRHGTPLISRELVLGPPGSGALGRGLDDRFDRWVLLLKTDVSIEDANIHTSFATADLSDKTIGRACQAGLDSVALVRAACGCHIARLRSESKWAIPREAFKCVSVEHANLLKGASRG